MFLIAEDNDYHMFRIMSQTGSELSIGLSAKSIFHPIK